MYCVHFQLSFDFFHWRAFLIKILFCQFIPPRYGGLSLWGGRIPPETSHLFCTSKLKGDTAPVCHWRYGSGWDGTSCSWSNWFWWKSDLMSCEVAMVESFTFPGPSLIVPQRWKLYLVILLVMIIFKSTGCLSVSPRCRVFCLVPVMVEHIKWEFSRLCQII